MYVKYNKMSHMPTFYRKKKKVCIKGTNDGL